MASWIFTIIAGGLIGAFLGHIIDQLRGINARLRRIDLMVDQLTMMRASPPPANVDAYIAEARRRTMRSRSAASAEKPFGTLMEERTR